MNVYLKGYRFRVPTEAELFVAGCQKDRFGIFTHPNFPDGHLTNHIVSKFGGLVFTTRQGPSPHGFYHVKETNQNLFHVELCEWAAGLWYPEHQQSPKTTNTISDSSSKPNHTCEIGMTPIDGWTICRICGKNLCKAGYR